jgi:hypothetical protein
MTMQFLVQSETMTLPAQSTATPIGLVSCPAPLPAPPNDPRGRRRVARRHEF